MDREIFSRDFALNFAGHFPFAFAVTLLIPTIPIYLSRSGATDAEIGILVGGFSVSSLFIRPLVGRALLKLPERDFMVAGILLLGLSCIAYLFARPFWPFLIARAFQGMAFGLCVTATFTLVTRLSPEARRGQSLSYFFLAVNIPSAVAPPLGIVILDRSGFGVLLFVCAGLSLCSLLITLRLGRVKPVNAGSPPAQEQPFLSREAVPFSMLAFLANIIWGTLGAFFPLFALSQGVANPGLFFTALAITLILARGLGGQVLTLYARGRVILPCIASQIIAMALLAFSNTLPMFILVAVIWGMGAAFLFPTLIDYAVEVGGSSHGPAVATFMAFADLGMSLGPALMGIVLQATSYRTTFLALVAVGLIDLGYFYLAIVKKRRGGCGDGRSPYLR
jgi:MFS family permease